MYINHENRNGTVSRKPSLMMSLFLSATAELYLSIGNKGWIDSPCLKGMIIVVLLTG